MTPVLSGLKALKSLKLSIRKAKAGKVSQGLRVSHVAWQHSVLWPHGQGRGGGAGTAGGEFLCPSGLSIHADTDVIKHRDRENDSHVISGIQAFLFPFLHPFGQARW